MGRLNVTAIKGRPQVDVHGRPIDAAHLAGARELYEDEFLALRREWDRRVKEHGPWWAPALVITKGVLLHHPNNTWAFEFLKERDTLLADLEVQDRFRPAPEAR